MRSTACSAERPSARSTTSWSTSIGGSTRSRTTGVPPAPMTCRTIESPRPLEPPVTTTVPMSRFTEDLLEELGRRATRGIGNDDHLAVPAIERGLLADRDPAVVAALDEQVGTELVEHARRGVLVEL